jgi:hypothetical protein
MASKHVNVGISPQADLALQETLLVLRRAGYRFSKQQLTSVACQHFALELQTVIAHGEAPQLQSLLEHTTIVEPQSLAA